MSLNRRQGIAAAIAAAALTVSACSSGNRGQSPFLPTPTPTPPAMTPTPTATPTPTPTATPTPTPTATPTPTPTATPTPTPTATPTPTPAPAAVGKDVFRFETFGNERFWTDAMQLPQGIIAAGLTPLQALGLGLNVNAEALEPAFAGVVVQQINEALAGREAPALSDPAITLALIRQGAVIGVVPFGADGNRLPLGSEPGFDPEAPIARIGVSCALCHARTDDSVLARNVVGPGSVGVQVDGIVAEGLDVGAIFAAAANPLAYLPFLQLKFDALDGATLGRAAGDGAFTGIDSSLSIAEQTAQARAYLTGTNAAGLRHYPLTSFDATPDGIGNATYTPPFFRTDLAAPWGSSGTFERLEDFNNLVYTVALDPTTLLTEKGRALLNVLAGPVGDEIAERYEAVLRATGVIPEGVAATSVVPFVQVARDDLPAGASEGPVGLRVDEAKLLALNAYTDRLPAPPAPEGLDPAMVAFGERLFFAPRNQMVAGLSEGMVPGAGCAGCHRAADLPVERDRVRPITQVYGAYNQDLLVLLDRSGVGLSPIQTTLAGPEPEYDLTLVVLDATRRGQENFVRGYAKPLLLGLAEKDEFLHNGSIKAPEGVATGSANPSLNWLLDPARERSPMPVRGGGDEPHAFYYPALAAFRSSGDDATAREALTQYLLSRTAGVPTDEELARNRLPEFD